MIDRKFSEDYIKLACIASGVNWRELDMFSEKQEADQTDEVLAEKTDILTVILGVMFIAVLIAIILYTKL
jgi:hypothetical protein